jgi:hypothetical protein
MSSKYTAEQVASALTESQGMVTNAARRLGCTRKTVYNYIEKYVTVREALDDARESLGDRIEATLLSEAFGNSKENKDPNITALIFLAKTHPAMRKRGYAERTEVTGADGGAIIFKSAQSLDDV